MPSPSVLFLLSSCSENQLVRIGDDNILPDGEPIADAGVDLSAEVGDSVRVDGSASYDPGGLEITAYQWFLASGPSGSSAPELADTKKVSFTADVPGTYEYQLTVSNAFDIWDSTPDAVQIVVGGDGPPVSDAGPDEETTPLVTFPLDGTASFDPSGLEPLTYAWSVVSVPVNSRASLDDPTSATPRFFADLAGDYVFSLAVTNTDGVIDPTPDEVVITVSPADGFYVEASWPGNADIDLHLANSLANGIFDCPNDCSFDNPTPSWFAAGTADDPSLDEDTIPSVSGSGPEIITISDPADDVYTVRVHYFGEGGLAICSGPCAEADVTVNVYLGGVLAATVDRTLTESGDVWNVGTIEYPSGLVTEVDALNTTSKISCD